MKFRSFFEAVADGVDVVDIGKPEFTLDGKTIESSPHKLLGRSEYDEYGMEDTSFPEHITKYYMRVEVYFEIKDQTVVAELSFTVNVDGDESKMLQPQSIDFTGYEIVGERTSRVANLILDRYFKENHAEVINLASRVLQSAQ